MLYVFDISLRGILLFIFFGDMFIFHSMLCEIKMMHIILDN